MTNIFLLLAILGANIIAITLVYKFVKTLPKMQRIIFIGASVAIVYGAVSVIYWISGFGIDSSINDAARDFVTFLFVPVNVILFIPFIATKYIKFKDNKISKRDFLERLIKVCLVALVVLTIECIYFKFMKQDIKLINSLQNNKRENTITNNVQQNNIDNNIETTITTNTTI